MLEKEREWLAQMVPIVSRMNKTTVTAATAYTLPFMGQPCERLLFIVTDFFVNQYILSTYWFNLRALMALLSGKPISVSC